MGTSRTIIRTDKNGHNLYYFTDDFRLIRISDPTKEINKEQAIKLLSKVCQKFPDIPGCVVQHTLLIEKKQLVAISSPNKVKILPIPVPPPLPSWNIPFVDITKQSKLVKIIHQVRKNNIKDGPISVMSKKNEGITLQLILDSKNTLKKLNLDKKESKKTSNILIENWIKNIGYKLRQYDDDDSN